MPTPGAILNIGSGSGQNHFNLGIGRDGDGSITTKTQADISGGYTEDPYFSEDDTGVWANFGIRLDAVTTEGSDYPRSELRELDTDGTTLYGFNPTTGDHWMQGTTAIDILARYKKAMVIGQLHDTVSDVVMIASQNVDSAPYPLDGAVKIVIRINGTGVGIPVPIPNYVIGRPIPWKIRVGATFGWEVYIDNMVTPFCSATSTGISLAASGLCYFKAGCYSNTNATVEATGGGSPSNFYVKCRLRDLKHWHTSWPTPQITSTGDDFVPGTGIISNVRWGTKATLRNTGGAGGTLNPTLPGSLADGDILFCIVRASRGVTSTSTAYTSGAPYTSNPSSPSIASGWKKFISSRSPVATESTGAYPGGPQLAAHNVRWQLWGRKWVTGDGAPAITYSAATTTDTVVAIVGACSGAHWSTVLEEFLDQLPAGLDPGIADDNTNNYTGINYAGGTSTTAIGPTAATPDIPAPGSLAIACVFHETNATTGGVAVVTGGTDSLTWAEGVEGATTTVTPAAGSSNSGESEQAWAVDWAIVPSSGYNQVIPAKTAQATISNDANKPNASQSQAGKGWGVMFTINAEQPMNHGMITACAGAAL